MNILLINPNTSDSVSDLIRAEAEISQRIRAWYRETVQHIGLEGRLASIRGLDEPLTDIGNVQGNQGERLVALAERCVDEDGADVIVAGAPLAGLARSLRGRLPVPVVDGVSSAVRHVESLIALQPGKAVRGSFAPPRQSQSGT